MQNDIFPPRRLTNYIPVLPRIPEECAIYLRTTGSLCIDWYDVKEDAIDLYMQDKICLRIEELLQRTGYVTHV